jgi:hypothetical protein
MKKLYSLVACLGISTAIMAQSLNGFEQFNHLRPANKIEKNKNVDRFTGSKFIDYEGYEDYVIGLSNGELKTFIDWINKNDTTDGSYLSAIQTFDSLIVTSDYQVWDSENYFATPMRIDSVYMSIHHRNNSSAEDSIFIRIIELSPYTTNPLTSCRPTNTVLWADTIIVTSSLTNPPTPTGYPVQAFAFPVGYNLPANKRFGVSVTFSGPPSDSLGILYGFPHYPGTPCANSNLAAIGIWQMAPGALYPSAFVTVLVNGNPILTPTTSGLSYYFYDCNNNGSPNFPVEDPLKVWSIWVRVSEVASVSENNITKFRVSQNMPNPAANSTTIKYELKENANVTLRVFDIAGKEVIHINEGTKSSGIYTIELNTASLQNGVYFYSFEAGAEKVTRKMTIAK